MAILTINGVQHAVDAPDDTRLLWIIREYLRLTGTKFGCGIAQCGACTVHMNGEAVRSCQIPLSDAVGASWEGLMLIVTESMSVCAPADPMFPRSSVVICRVSLVSKSAFGA